MSHTCGSRALHQRSPFTPGAPEPHFGVSLAPPSGETVHQQHCQHDSPSLILAVFGGWVRAGSGLFVFSGHALGSCAVS
eukprot:11961433-Alexandrium_andersonii.AAC.1